MLQKFYDSSKTLGLLFILLIYNFLSCRVGSLEVIMYYYLLCIFVLEIKFFLT